MQSFVRVIIASSFLVGACVSEPDDSDNLGSAGEAVSRAPQHSLTGGGRVDYDLDFLPSGYSETYGISARLRPDGSAEGNIEFHWDPPFDVKAHGDITCLKVQGNAAGVGLVITRSDNPAFPEGLELIFSVVDNGSGHNAPDQISGFGGAPAEVCQDLDLGDGGGLFDWTHGNITVR